MSHKTSRSRNKNSESITFKVAVLTNRVYTAPRPYLASSFSCVADMPHRRTLTSASTDQIRSTFRFSVGLRSEVAPSLLLEPKCGTVNLAMSHLLRRYRSSGTG